MCRKMFVVILGLSLTALFACGDERAPVSNDAQVSSGELNTVEGSSDHLDFPDHVTLPADMAWLHFKVQITDTDGETPLSGAHVAVDLATGERLERTTWLSGVVDFGWLSQDSYPLRATVAKNGYVVLTTAPMSRDLPVSLKGQPVPITMLRPGAAVDQVKISGKAYNTGSALNLLTVSPSVPGTTWQSINTNWTVRVQSDTPFALVSSLVTWGDRSGLSEQGYAQEFVAWNVNELSAIPFGVYTFPADIDFADPYPSYSVDGSFPLPGWMSRAQARAVRAFSLVSSYHSGMALFAGASTRIDINDARDGFEYTTEWVETKAITHPITRYLLEFGDNFAYVDVPGVPLDGPQILDFMKPPTLLSNPSLYAPTRWLVAHEDPGPYGNRAMMTYVVDAHDKLVWITSAPLHTSPGELLAGVTTFPALPASIDHGAIFSVDNGPYTAVMVDCTWQRFGQGQCERAAGVRAPMGVWNVEVPRPDLVSEFAFYAARFRSGAIPGASDCPPGDASCWANSCDSHSECSAGMSCTEGRCMPDRPEQDDPRPVGPFFPVIPHYTP